MVVIWQMAISIEWDGLFNRKTYKTKKTGRLLHIHTTIPILKTSKMCKIHFFNKPTENSHDAHFYAETLSTTHTNC